MRRSRFLLPVLAAGLLLGACGGESTFPADQLEQNIHDELVGQTGVEPASVDCPDDVPVEEGRTFDCVVTADDGTTATVTVTQLDDQGNVDWEVTSTG